MRARAAQMAGAHAEAHDLYQMANQDAAAAQAAWLAEDWEELTTPDNSTFGPVLALSDAEISVSTEREGMLARSSAALADAADPSL